MTSMRRLSRFQPEPLYGAASTRLIEQRALAARPPHHLMGLAGASVARLAQAIAPHARTVAVLCGPGNNGGDGLVAATRLHEAARRTGLDRRVVVSLCADPARLPADAAHALQDAQAAGVPLQTDVPAQPDLFIDALLGLGPLRTPEGDMAQRLQMLQASAAPVLCVDLPSGLDADSGRHWAGPLRQPLPGERHTLALLTLKPGLFTADGRDQAGTVWFDELGVPPDPSIAPDAWWHTGTAAPTDRAHATHKGSRGDVLLIGGQDIALSGHGMTGAAVLAARAALHAGAGRVFLSLLDAPDQPAPVGWDPVSPELMFRRWHALRAGDVLDRAVVVCGCGGGQAVAEVLPEVLARATTLVLDADALNAVAAHAPWQQSLRQRAARGLRTVLTPHPLEAARLLDSNTAAVMADRLVAARQLSERYQAICVLKGSGTVICAPDDTPLINASGNAALATAGTCDVLAGMICAALAGAAGQTPLQAVAQAVHAHGERADRWVSTRGAAGHHLSADALARGLWLC